MIEQHIAHGFSVLRYHSWGQNLFLPPALFLRDCKELVKVKDVYYVFQSVCHNAMKTQGVNTFHEVYDSVQFAAAA